MYLRIYPGADLDRNGEYCTYPGAWSAYILIIVFSWLVVVSVFPCSPGTAWTVVHLLHFLVTYHFLHCTKGTLSFDDQGIYDDLTWWEQIDNGKQRTPNRKFLTTVPVVLYFIASFTSNHENPKLIFNTVAVIILVAAKFPITHEVGISGSDSDD